MSPLAFVVMHECACGCGCADLFVHARVRGAHACVHACVRPCVRAGGGWVGGWQVGDQASEPVGKSCKVQVAKSSLP